MIERRRSLGRVAGYASSPGNVSPNHLQEMTSMIFKGDYIKGYFVEQRLGSEGSGEVYLVNDGRDPARKYARKIIRRGADRDDP